MRSQKEGHTPHKKRQKAGAQQTTTITPKIHNAISHAGVSGERFRGDSG